MALGGPPSQPWIPTTPKRDACTHAAPLLLASCPPDVPTMFSIQTLFFLWLPCFCFCFLSITCKIKGNALLPSGCRKPSQPVARDGGGDPGACSACPTCKAIKTRPVIPAVVLRSDVPDRKYCFGVKLMAAGNDVERSRPAAPRGAKA